MHDVSSFLATLGLERYSELFDEHEIEYKDFVDLTAHDLIELNLPLGPRRKILQALKSVDDQAVSEAIERRQLTVVFVDIVGFTEMSHLLDPEELFEMIARYQSYCAEVIEDFGGQVAQYIGDGIVAFFGWPVTSETSTQNATRASLAIAAKAGTLETSGQIPFSVRVGMDNGLVLIRKMTKGSADVFGTTVNLSARLQSVAGPGEVIVSQRVKNMIQRRFQCQPIGAVELKGFEEPVSAWRVEEENRSVVPATSDESPSPLIGRERQIAALRSTWAEADDQNRRIVCIRGDPGLGKSRLASDFLKEVGEEARTFSFYGAPDARQTPLWPIRKFVSAAAGVDAGDSGPLQRKKLQDFFDLAGLDSEHQIAPVAELFGLGDAPATTGDTPERRKAALFDALLRLVQQQTEGAPAVVLFEDLHWFDPTSQEFVSFLANSSTKAPELFLVTARPYPELADWINRLTPNCIDLETLSKSDAETVFLNQAGDTGQLDRESVLTLVARSDGVPLFIEELANSAKNTDLVSGIPDTLAESLMARLDKLGETKEIAQTAAVLDRDITENLLSVATGKPVDYIRVSISRLVEERVLVPASANSGQYFFRHALLREAAYENQLLRVRQQTHSKLADILIRDEPEQAELRPERVANHLSQAKRHHEAMEFFRKAGVRALSQAHYLEAETLFRDALEQLTVSGNEADKVAEVGILTELGAALIAREGFGADNVGETFNTAERIGREVGPGPALVGALWGNWLYCLVSGDLKRANSLTVELNAFGEAALAAGDSNLLVEARFARGNTLYWQNDIAGSLAALNHAVELYDPVAHANHALLFGQDPLVATQCYLAYCNWAGGDHVASWQALKSANAQAKIIDHPFTTAWALCFPPMITSLRRETWAARRFATTAIDHTAKQMLPFWNSAMTIVRGWATAHQGDVEAGLAEAISGLDRYILTGSNTVQPYFRGLVAECLSLAGQFDPAQEMLDQAFAGARSSGEKISENTLLIYSARLLRARGENPDEIVAPLQAAIDMARESGAVTIEIEAALQLYDIHPGQEAREILQEAVSRAPQPHKTREGRRARLILDS